jgi:hypothetical protein
MTKPFAAAVIGAMLATGNAAASEYTRFEPLPYALPSPTTATGQCNRLALMNLPPGWRRGDAAVVLLTEAALRDPLRNDLVAALLHAGASVVEAVSGPGAACGPGDAEETPAAATEAEPLDVLFAVLEAVRRAGAGLVIAVGYGPGGEAALEAVQGNVAARRSPETAPRFAAAASLGLARPAFAIGAPMPPEEAAPIRLPLFCAAIEELQALMDSAACHAALSQSAGITIGRQH